MPQSSEFIEYLLWVMEQTDSPEATVRRRWWAYMSKVEHPEDRIDRVWCAVREGAEPAGATGVFVLPPQVEAGWRDVASPPFSMVPSTLASFQQWR